MNRWQPASRREANFLALLTGSLAHHLPFSSSRRGFMTSFLRWTFVTAIVLNLAFMFTQLSASYYSGDMSSYWSQTPFGSYSGAIPGVLWLNYGFMKELGNIAVLLRIGSVCLWFLTLMGIIVWVKRRLCP